MARAIMGAGLLPSIGIFHRNYYNSFTLADDLMEPYRPFIDETAYHLYEKYSAITDAVKSAFAGLFYSSISFDALSSSAHSVAIALLKEGNSLFYPDLA